jgi:hypothetical protein
MHLGQISFCDRINYNIKDSDIKDDILRELNELCQIQILQRHWHRLDEDSIKYLQRQPHLTCLRSNGNPYYMYFTLYEDVPIVYYIDKKVQPGYQRPRIILCKGLWDKELFKGTLLDGEMVKTFDNKWIYLINDILAYKGEYLASEALPDRLEHAIEMLDKYYTEDSTMDVCKYQVKKYARCTQQGVGALVELSKDLNYTSRGLYFYPFSCKYKPKLINFDDSLIKSVVRKVKDVPDFMVSSQSEVVKPEISKEVEIDKKEVDKNDKTLWLRKTENPDVYDVYTTDHGMVNNTRIGIACVQTMTTSKMLRSIFKDTTVAIYIPFNCKYNESANKWVPMHQVK